MRGLLDDEATERRRQRWAEFRKGLWRTIKMGLTVVGIVVLVLTGATCTALMNRETQRPCTALGGHYESAGVLTNGPRCWSEDGRRLWPKEWE